MIRKILGVTNNFLEVLHVGFICISFILISNYGCSLGVKEKGVIISSKPNILLLFSGDHQADMINALGNPYIMDCQYPYLEQTTGLPTENNKNTFHL